MIAAPNLRAIPSVERLLQTPQAADLSSAYGRPLTLETIRLVLAEVREGAAQEPDIPSSAEVLQRVGQRLARWRQSGLTHVINATGVILHTNLGRAPLSQAAVQAMAETAQGYTNLEINLDSGKRGSRQASVEGLLTRLTGGEAALVVNNNAASVLLALTALARRKRVVISRTQLVEIGGGFRIPEVLNQSGAHLLEIGATNSVHLDDYRSALETPAGLVLYVYPSNFRIQGFTSQPELGEIAKVTHRAGAYLVVDLGSGALLDTAPYGLTHEPLVSEVLAAGADLVCFSGDKLLGGPQAGILVGRADLIARLAKHPLARALRADKLCLAALSATLQHYLKGEAEREIPIWQMISTPQARLEQRAQRWVEVLGRGGTLPGESTIGGGSLPGENLTTTLFVLPDVKPDPFLKALRQQNTPIVARIQEGQVVFDPRTVLPFEEAALLDGLRKACEQFG